MTSWFPANPTQPTGPRYKPIPWHPWSRAPENELGVLVPIQLELARGADFVLGVQSVFAYSCGFEIFLVLRRQQSAEGPRTWETAGDGMRDLHFGVEFEDGSRTLMGRGPDPNVKAWFDRYWTDRRPAPDGPTMMSFGGGTSERQHWNNWIWPLPPGSVLRLGWEWRAAEVAFGTCDVDAEAIRRAAAKSEPLWEAASPREEG